MFGTYYGNYNKSLEFLNDYSDSYKQNNQINILTTTTFLPQPYRHTSRRYNHYHHGLLNEIDWNFELERERENRDRMVFNEKMAEIKHRRSRPRTIHYKTRKDEKFRSVDRSLNSIKKTRSHSNDLKLYKSGTSSPNPYLNEDTDIYNQHKLSKKCSNPTKKSNKKNCKNNKKFDNAFSATSAYATSASCSSTNNNDSNSEKENKLETINKNTVSVPLKETGVQTHLMNEEEISKNKVNEEKSNTNSNKQVENYEQNYVQELKIQLDSLKNEIGRLHDAQTNLEKSLKSQAAFRPIVLTDFDVKAGQYNFDELIPPEYRFDTNYQELFSNGLLETLNDENQSQYLINQQLIYNPSNGLFEQQNQPKQAQDADNFLKNGYQVDANSNFYCDPNVQTNKDANITKLKLCDSSKTSVLNKYDIIKPNITAAASNYTRPLNNMNSHHETQAIITSKTNPAIYFNSSNDSNKNDEQKFNSSSSSLTKIINSNNNISTKADIRNNSIENKSTTRLNNKVQQDYQIPLCYDFESFNQINNNNGSIVPTVFADNCDKQKTMSYDYEITDLTQKSNDGVLKYTTGILKNSNKNQINQGETRVNNAETYSVKFTTENMFNYEFTPTNSSNATVYEDDSAHSSANALLYERLQQLVSHSSIDLPNEQMSIQINKLLSNPNIKHQLKQLHTQLLANPSHYLPQLENILLTNSSSLNMMTDCPNSNGHCDFGSYNNENMNMNNFFSNRKSSTSNIDNSLNNDLNHTNQRHPTARIISRDYNF